MLDHYCGACRGALNRVITGGVTTWVHTDADQRARGPASHDPQPVPVSEMDWANTYCDFCSMPAPAWSVRFRAVAKIVSIDRETLDTCTDNYGSHWLACTRCKELVVARDPAGLLGRVVAALRRNGLVVTPSARADLDEMYRGLIAAGFDIHRIEAGDPLGLRGKR